MARARLCAAIHCSRECVVDTWLSGKDQEAARKAFDRAAALQREPYLLIEGQFRELPNEWDRAIQICRSLWTFFPDNSEYDQNNNFRPISPTRGAVWVPRIFPKLPLVNVVLGLPSTG